MKAPPRRRWAELTTEDFAAPEVRSWIAILPVAATEQHGPHLPAGVDTIISEGLLDAALSVMPADLPAIALPVLAVGKSDEHQRFRGTLSLSAETLLHSLVEIGESVARAGVAKLVIMSSHGGNNEVMSLAARRLRLLLEMLVVPTSWARLGHPDGLFSDAERRHGIHAGDIETSLMLHLAPDLVRMDQARNFVSASSTMETEFAVLRGTGGTGFAWLAGDLNPEGACGDATRASAEKGEAAAQYAIGRFIDLIGDIARFDMARIPPP
jgi:creatinine amidohydrolase